MRDTPKAEGVMKVSEANVQKAITDFLDAKKVFWMRCNAGDRLMQSKGKTYRIKGHEKGTADLLVLLKTRPEMWPQPVWIEVKRPGGKQSAEQKAFAWKMIEHGCTYLLVDSVDQVIDWFRSRAL